MTASPESRSENVQVRKGSPEPKKGNGAAHQPQQERSMMAAPNIGRWMEEMRRDVESWMNRGLPRLGIHPQGMQMPRTDVSDIGDHYAVVAEVPGVMKNDVEISARDGRLELRAAVESEREEEKKNYYHREIGRRAYYRNLPLPDDADAESAEASMQNGCLHINVPKRSVNERGKKIPLK